MCEWLPESSSRPRRRTRTATDGRVKYSVKPRSDFPLENGYSVQLFVKAYRKGDLTLAGISGTRLVQVATATS